MPVRWWVASVRGLTSGFHRGSLLLFMVGCTSQDCPCSPQECPDDDDTEDDDTSIDDDSGDDDTEDDDDTSAGSTPINLNDADTAYWGYLGLEAGSTVSFAGDIDCDGEEDLLFGAATSIFSNPDVPAVYLVLGPLTPGTSYLKDAQAKLVGTSISDGTGLALSEAGDVDGDGCTDIVVGSHGNYYSSPGRVYLEYGVPEGEISLLAFDVVLEEEQHPGWPGLNDTQAGEAVSIAGDLDGDGLDDLVVGAPDSLVGNGYFGRVYILYGPVLESGNLASADAILNSPPWETMAGTAVSTAGDVDGDGRDDVLVGAPSCSTNDPPFDRGGAYLVHGPVYGEVSLADADAIFLGEASYDWAGAAVSIAGDLNGDGLDDVVIGAPWLNDRTGKVYVYYSPVVGELDLASADARLTGEEPCDLVGNSISTAGDVTGDGVEDLLIGAPWCQPFPPYKSPGKAYLVAGPITGWHDLPAVSLPFVGEGSWDFAGWSVALGGDPDQDGLGDLLIGAPGNDDLGSEAGKVYLFYGANLALPVP
jgi:FG-GAP repeat